MITNFSTDEISNALDFENRAAWREWLDKNHAGSDGVWVIVHKKASPLPRLILEDAVEEAICYGWIDSRLNRVDENRFALWFTRRRPTSIWSQNNRNRVAKLETAGLMMPPGLKTVEIAKENGSWLSLIPIDNLEPPGDLKEAFEKNPDALANFEAFTETSKKLILRWIDIAKRSDTRARRIKETVASATKNRSPIR